MDIYNVTFAGDWGWIGTTILARDEDDAIEHAKNRLYMESMIPWEVISTMPHVEAEYIGTEEEDSNGNV